MFKRFLTTGLLSLFGVLAFLPTFALAENQPGMIEVRIHKGDEHGDIWTNEAYPILVKVLENGSPMGIGNVTDSNKFGIDPNQGGLVWSSEASCHFEWDQDGQVVERDFTLPKYRQLARGEFLAPPERMSSEVFLVEGASDSFCSPAGGEEEYNEWRSLQKENPFLTYSESLRVYPSGGGKIQISIEDPDGNILTPSGEPLPGYTCRLEETLDGTSESYTILGKCTTEVTLQPGEKRIVNLTIISDGTGLASHIAGDDRLEQGIDAEFSEGVTMVGQFMIRSTRLLDWALQINDHGFHNAKVESIFQIFVNVANSFFVISLLVIAFLWNFSTLLPKEKLKRMMVLFAISAVFVNLALPFTRLVIDGTTLIERSFLQKPSDEALQIQRMVENGEDVNLTEEQYAALDTKRPIEATDILGVQDMSYGGFIGLQKTAYTEKSYPQELGTPVDAKRFTSKEDLYIDRFQEATMFNLILIFLMSLGQLLIALILLFRNVILWFLLIFSPFLFVLVIFGATRFVFRYWSYLYFRWIFIGPLLAMCLYITVNIWSTAGVPIESSYEAPSSLYFQNTLNLNVAAPGITGSSLNTPREVMKYIAALMMLYMVIILPFWLTRILPGMSGGDGGFFFNKKKGGFFQKIGGNGGGSSGAEPNGGSGKDGADPKAVDQELQHLSNKGVPLGKGLPEFLTSSKEKESMIDIEKSDHVDIEKEHSDHVDIEKEQSDKLMQDREAKTSTDTSVGQQEQMQGVVQDQSERMSRFENMNQERAQEQRTSERAINDLSTEATQTESQSFGVESMRSETNVSGEEEKTNEETVSSEVRNTENAAHLSGTPEGEGEGDIHIDAPVSEKAQSLGGADGGSETRSNGEDGESPDVEVSTPSNTTELHQGAAAAPGVAGGAGQTPQAGEKTSSGGSDGDNTVVVETPSQPSREVNLGDLLQGGGGQRGGENTPSDDGGEDVDIDAPRHHEKKNVEQAMYMDEDEEGQNPKANTDQQKTLSEDADFLEKMTEAGEDAHETAEREMEEEKIFGRDEDEAKVLLGKGSSEEQAVERKIEGAKEAAKAEVFGEEEFLEGSAEQEQEMEEGFADLMDAFGEEDQKKEKEVQDFEEEHEALLEDIEEDEKNLDKGKGE